MKRVILPILCFLIAGAVVFGLVKAMPLIRYAIQMERHVQQAALREPAAEREWRREFGDPADTLSAFPKLADSETAVRVMALAHRVGADMARPKKGLPAPRESAAERARNEAIRDYVNLELAKPGGDIGPMPATASRDLEEREPNLDAISDFLAGIEPPTWERDISLGFEAPIPNLLGHVRLQRLLVAQALNKARIGRPGEAEKAFNASWVLNASLRDRPDVMSQLIAISIARMQVGLARRLSLEPSRWIKRFADHDYRSSLLRALEVASITGLRQLPKGSSRWDRASRVDFLDMRRTFLVGLRDFPVADGPVDLPRTSDNSYSAGAIVASMALPNHANAGRRVDRLIMDTELTERILQARMLKAGLGQWPAEIPNFSSSRMLGVHWIYSVGADGRLKVSLSRELDWETPSGLVLPQCYEST